MFPKYSIAKHFLFFFNYNLSQPWENSTVLHNFLHWRREIIAGKHVLKITFYIKQARVFLCEKKSGQFQSMFQTCFQVLKQCVTLPILLEVSLLLWSLYKVSQRPTLPLEVSNENTCLRPSDIVHQRHQKSDLLLLIFKFQGERKYWPGNPLLSKRCMRYQSVETSC